MALVNVLHPHVILFLLLIGFIYFGMYFLSDISPIHTFSSTVLAPTKFPGKLVISTLFLCTAMDERHLRRRLREVPRNVGHSTTAGSVPLTITQCCTHRQGVKCVKANTCLCQATNRPCTSSFPSENRRNR